MKDKIRTIVDNHLATVREQLRTSDNHIHDTLDHASEQLIEKLGKFFETDIDLPVMPKLHDEVIQPNIDAERILSSKHYSEPTIHIHSDPFKINESMMNVIKEWHQQLDFIDNEYCYGFRFDEQGLLSIIDRSDPDTGWEYGFDYPNAEKMKKLISIYHDLKLSTSKDIVVWFTFGSDYFKISMNKVVRL